MVEVSGRICSIGWRDEHTGETYARIAPEAQNKSRQSYGILAHLVHPLVVGECANVRGVWTSHAKLGQILEVKSLDRRPPSTREGEIIFLAGFIKGMGKKTATELLERYGGLEALINLCRNNPHLLEEALPKATKLRARLRSAQWDRTEVDIDLFTALHSAKVRTDQIQRLVRHFGANSLRVIAQTRPYDFCEVPRIGFATAEKVAQFYAEQQGRPFDGLDPARLLHGVCDVVAQERQNGDVCLPEEAVLKKAIWALRMPGNKPLPQTAETTEKLRAALGEALKRRLLKKEYDMIYTRGLERAEKELALHVSKLLKAGAAVDRADIRVIEKMLAADTKFKLTDEQEEAVKMAVTRPISLITGGPGCGKTLTSSKIVQAIKKLNRTFMVLAPTGKAAKRAADVMQEEASTIHRACGLDQEDDVHSQRYGRKLTRHDYFRVDYVLVDEASMIDLNLGFELIRRIKPGRTRLILIGDVDQLPPVGAGQVFRDLLEAKARNRKGEMEHVIPTQRLTKIHRQAGGSPIIDCAYAINRGEMPMAPADPERAYEVRMLDPFSSKEYDPTIDKESREELEARIILKWLLYSVDRYAKDLGIDPLRDIQVYAPQKKGAVGLFRLNEVLRDHFNPLPVQGPSFREAIKIYGSYIVQPGDKVMQIQNNYKMRYAPSAPADASSEFLNKKSSAKPLGKPKRKKSSATPVDEGDVVPVMNGQLGYVTRVDYETREVEVQFEDLPYPVLYRNSTEWGKLSPAYAMSIHRSQGSETPYAFIVLHSGMMMCNRPLLYTAWTRAKKGVLLIAGQDVVQRAVTSLSGVERFSNLRRRLLEYTGHAE